MITNTWIYVQVDDLSEQNIPLLRRLLVQLEIARKFREDFLDVFGQEVPLGQNANIFLARSTLLYSQQEPLPASVPLERFRQISLTVLPLKMKIRVALNSRGVSDKGLNLFLLIVVDRFLQLEVITLLENLKFCPKNQFSEKMTNEFEFSCQKLMICCVLKTLISVRF